MTARASRSLDQPYRRRLRWLIIAAVIFALLGWVAPPALIALSQPLQLGQSARYVTDARPAQLLSIPDMVAGTVPEQNRDEPGCQDPSSRTAACYQVVETSQLDRLTTTDEAASRREAMVDSRLNVTVGKDSRAELLDHSQVYRDTRMPVEEPHAIIAAQIPDLMGAESVEQTRDGLSFFFPPEMQRRSFPYFDMLAQQSVPIDYVGETEVNNIDAYEFHHAIAPVSLVDSFSRMHHPNRELPEDGSEHILHEVIAEPDQLKQISTGPASRFYTDEELTSADLPPRQDVALTPYYTVERTAVVEPKTGTLLTFREDFYLYFARNGAEAQQMASDGPHPLRTLFWAQEEWNEQTVQQQLDQVRPQLQMLRFLQVWAWVLKAVAVLTALAAIVLVAKKRGQLHQRIVAEG